MNIRAFIVTLIAVLAAAEEPQNSLSRRLLGSSHLGAVSPPRIQFEVYKALIGETVRLECPQPNPTWFFRKASSSAANQEDLIVTRHGVINVDYKYKIMCHMSLKHKVIIVNNVEFEDEGLYTCLYTLPTAADDEYNQIATSSVQYRHVFNVTVYTLISGLTMSLKPISMQKAPIPSPSLRIFNLEKNRQPSPTDGSSVGGGGGLNGYELVDSSLTVRQNEEFFITCTVDSSRPAAEIRFVMLDASESSGNSEDSPSGHPIQSLNSNSQLGYLTLSPNAFNGETMSSTAQPPQHSSIVESSSNVVGNADKTFKTVHTARLKVGRDDHGKMITCKAENGFSNQKWENKKLLNILFAPVCKDPPRHTYYVGINQTATIECNILTANPARVQFEWDLQNVNYYPQQPSSFMGIVKRQIGGGVMPSSLGASYTNDILSNDISGEGSQLSSSSILLGGGSVIGPDKSYLEPTPIKPKFTGLVNEGLASRFKWRPTSMSDFGEIVCKATNEIGTTECVYEIRLGGVPNPPSECTHTVKNTSAIISCQVGFHQGDPDIYCYLLRKSDNGVYKEHTRNRESCSFIVNDVNVNKLNEFWIYSSNKHGHNKDNGVYLTIGQTSKPVQQYPSRNWMIFGFLAAIVVFIGAVCCFSFKFKKGTSDDNDSIFEGDNYQHSRGIMSSSQGVKKMSNSGGYSSKMIKGVKVSSQDAMFESSENQQKYVKIDFYPTQMDEEFIKQDYTDNSSTMKRRDLKQLQSGNYLPSETEFIESTTSGSAYYDSKPTAPPHKHSLTQYQPEYKSINEELKRKQKERTLLKTPNTQQQQINKSTSFSTKSSSPNDSSEKGLLTTVSNAKQAQTNNSNNDTSSSSCSSDKSSSSLSEGQSVNVAAAKMVTFSSNSMSRKTKSSTNTTETATTATTIVTTSTINGGGNNNEIGSASASATSTTSTGTSASPSVSLSSAHNDLDVSHEAPLTVSDQSFVLQRPNKLTMPNPMSTFGPTNDTNKFRSPRRFINSTNNIKHQAPSVQLNGGAHPQLSVSSSISPPKSTTYVSAAAGTAGPVNSNNNNNLDRIFSSSTTNTSSQFGSSKFSDIIESRFLNKLCEDIEVSLNVDFDCADDYSINDFSGDYSFDNDLKSPVTNGACKLPFSGKPGGPLNKHLNKNAVAHAHVHQSTLNGHSHAPKRPQPQSQSQDSSSPTKSQLGVLV